MALIDKLTAIANGFRSSRGITDKLSLDEMATLAAEPVGGENPSAALIARSVTDIKAEHLQGISVIGRYAFANWVGDTWGTYKSLYSIEFPAGEITVKAYAFRNCTDLETIHIKKGAVLNLNTNSTETPFDGATKLKNIYVEDMDDWYNTKFGGYGTNTLIQNESVSIYYKNAYNEYELLEHLVTPANITEIGVAQFQNYSYLKTAVITDNITLINSYAFYKCTNLESVTIGNGVTSIGSYTFYNCTNLTDLTIPASVTNIRQGALAIGSTTNKGTITFLGTTPPTIDTSTFYTSRLEKIIVPAGYGNTYRNATNWANFADYIEEATE